MRENTNRVPGEDDVARGRALAAPASTGSSDAVEAALLDLADATQELRDPEVRAAAWR